MLASKKSIKRQLVMVIMLTSLIVLLLTVVAFMAYDLTTFRETMRQNLTTLARVIAENSNAALKFKDPQDSQQVLLSLRTEPHIVAAALYDESGKLFVKYPPAAKDLPLTPQELGSRFSNSQLTILQPVVLSGARVGTLYLRSDTRAMTARLELYALISVLILLASMVVAFFLSNALQRQISDPVVALAEIARKVSLHRDYSVRAKKTNDDEIGLLTDAFNQMLTRIEENAKANALLVAIVESSEDAIISKNLDAIITSWNRGAERLFGYTAKETIGKSITMLIPADLISEELDILKQIREGRAVEHFETIRLRKDGSEVDVSLTISPIHNERGEITGASKTARNITEKKRAERELKRARDEAVAASRAKDEFLAALSHELRTPLSPVLLLASEAAGNPDLPADVRTTFGVIAKNVELEARLIDDLLDLTRITRGKLSLTMQATDVHSILRDAINTVRSDLEQKRIQFVEEFKAEKPIVWGDSVRLQQIFWNILKNAVKFTSHSGRIFVATKMENGHVNIQIRDTGLGMTAHELKRVFHAFVQGDHATASGSHRFGGLGLGLAISQKLAELHSGVILAASDGRNQGSTFTVELPLIPAGEENNLPLRSQTSGPGTPSSGRRILLVEDHEPTRTALMHLLKRRRYEVLAAGSVAEATALAAEGEIDFVISDIGLPDGNGYDLMKELHRLYQVKGIALTGYGMENDILRSQEAGFVTHLTKPVHVQSLEHALETIQTILLP